ncbi:MAG: hypothetical protein KY461_13225 [Actinobacteria bacterium]|nr:hypothetical protein [Actinomycetota bacterium]
MRNRRLLSALVLAVLASGCQLSLATDIGIAADGSGTLEVAVAVDGELEQLLDDAGVDLSLGLADADAAASDWELEELDRDDGREVRLRTTFDEPGQLAARVEELHAGLDDADPAVLSDVELRVDDEGRVAFRADAGLRLPTTTGATGDGVTFDIEDLEELLRREGGAAARYDLRLTLPGRPVAHDADARRGRTLTWTLPIGEMRAVRAASERPADRTWVLVGATFLVSAAAATVLVAGTRRRGRRLAGERAERVSS